MNFLLFLQSLILKPSRVAGLMFALVSLTGAQALADDDSGSISGSVNFCGKGGVAGMMVYVPGKPYVLITDESGKFEFNGISPGQYDLVYSQQGAILNRNNAIEVRAGKQVLLGEIRFCLENAVTAGAKASPAAHAPKIVSDKADIDQDGDGVSASRDCRDDDASIRPGAREICDGVDNDCDGKIDNLDFAAIDHGSAKCHAGQLQLFSCDKGFADCDGNIKNGCEADLMNDGENCGSCGNSCSLEICALGTC